MYPVSDVFMQAIKSNTRKYHWTGTITTSDKKTYEFGNEDIVKGSGYISRQCCGNSEIELGSVYAAELGISLFCDIDRYTLDEAEIKLWFHLLLDDGSTESIPMGVFYVAEANRRIKTLELKAYDGMLNLDKSFNKGLSSAAPYEFLSLLSKACHVELAQTREEIEALPNGTELLGIYQDNGIESWRDFLYYLAQTLGCFAVMDRYGKLSLTSYGSTPVMTIDIRHRFSSSFSDFVTRYTAVSSTNKKTETAEYYAKDPDDGLTMNLGVNPLLQFGLEETRKRIINTILDVVSTVEYVPFDSETIGNPALDLGDVLRFTGGHADETKQSAITSIYTKINGKQTVKCVGKNPRLAAAKSKNDKNISGLISSIGETKLSIYTFTNALALDAGEEKLSIINMEFASGDETNAEFHAQAIMDVQSNPDTRMLTAETTIDLGTTTDDEGNEVENKKVISFPLSWNEDGKTALSVFYMLDGHEVEEFQKHIYESFTREERTVTNTVQGTGLGMAITKNIVDMMGGSISLTSTPGKGSCFEVILDFRIDEKREQMARKERKLLLLYCDDDNLSCILDATENYSVVTKRATTPGEARELLLKETFDAILVPYQTFGDNLKAEVQRIRHLAGEKKVLLGVTAEQGTEEENNAAESGLDGFIPLPFFLSNLNAEIERVQRGQKSYEEDVLRGMRFLCAEDNELNAEILCEMLEMKGASCTICRNGAEIVDKFQMVQPGEYDAILMDVQMPVMDGYEATRAIRSGVNPLGKTIPIIAMTANAFSEDVQKSYEAGMDSHLSKPVDFKALEEILCRFRVTPPEGVNEGIRFVRRK